MRPTRSGNAALSSLTRRSPFVATLLAAVLALTGCAAWGIGGGGSGKQVHLTYALWDAYEQVGYQKSINQFEKLHPNIKVTIEQIPYSSYQAKVTAQHISGNAPDVFWANTPWLGDWVNGGLITDITDRVKKANIDLSQYWPQLVTLHEKDGHLYGLPKDWDTIAYYYNKTYFAKHKITVPSEFTWNPDGSGTFLPFLKKLTTDSAGRNASQAGFNPNAITTYATAATNEYQASFGDFLVMNGGAMLDKPYATTSVFDSPQNRQTLNFLTRTLQQAHVVAPPAQTGLNGGSDNLATLFAQGRIAMWQAGDWNTTSLSQLSAFKVGVMELPAGPQGRVSVLNGLTDAIDSKTPHPEQAWELVQWLASAQSQKILGGGGYVWPAIKSLDPLFLNYWKSKGIDLSPFYSEIQGKTSNFPVATGIGEALNNITTELGPTYLGTASVDSGLKSATRILDYRIAYATK